MLRVNQRKRKTHLLNHRAATYGVGAPWASHISLRPRAHSKFIKTTASGHSQIILLIEREKEFSGGHRYSQTTLLASRIFLPSSLPSISSSLLFHPFSLLTAVLSLLAVGSLIFPFLLISSLRAFCASPLILLPFLLPTFLASFPFHFLSKSGAETGSQLFITFGFGYKFS
jgi:hypothetical protein